MEIIIDWDVLCTEETEVIFIGAWMYNEHHIAFQISMVNKLDLCYCTSHSWKIKSYHPCRVMSADTQNCFNALDKSYFCAISMLVSRDCKKISICLMGNKQDKNILMNKWYQTFKENTTPILQRSFYEMKIGCRVPHVPHSTTWNQISDSK